MRPAFMQHLHRFIAPRPLSLHQPYQRWADLHNGNRLRHQHRVHSQVAEAPELVGSSVHGSSPQSGNHTRPAFKASLDFRFIRDNYEAVAQNVKDRNSTADPKRVLQLYDEWRSLEDQTGHVRSLRNENARSMKVKPSRCLLSF